MHLDDAAPCAYRSRVIGLSDELRRRAEGWLAQDPDEETRAELTALLAAGAPDLEARFRGPLRFGTAGLRGILGAGESYFNLAVVRRTTAGLAAHLLARVPGAAERGVVVGYDGRRRSDDFARACAEVLAGAGIRVHLSDEPCPTPVVAFAVGALNAAAGVVITASHNPPEYNGYKVMGDNGAQIIPPVDAFVASAIDASGPATAITAMPLDEARVAGLVVAFGDELRERYLASIRALYPPATGDRSLGVVYTPLHGVGARWFEAAMREAGFGNVYTVPEQAEPDGRFPTVAMPNPEEPGALDLAVALATKRDAPLLLANDPDADRLAVAVRSAPGVYHQLSGNDVGVLLGHRVLSAPTPALRLPARAPGAVHQPLVVATLVSTPLIGVVARAFGARFEETLTGFKWICNRALQIEAEGDAAFVFGFEEALGYSVGRAVRDKDGISAAVVIACLAAELHARGETLLDELDRIYLRHGLFLGGAHSMRFDAAEGQQRMAELMQQLRRSPPLTLAGLPVEAVLDGAACRRTYRDGRVEPVALPPSDLLVFELADHNRVIARPSGTEPKLKLYFDVHEPVAGGTLDEARARGQARLAAMQGELLAHLQPSR